MSCIEKLRLIRLLLLQTEINCEVKKRQKIKEETVDEMEEINEMIPTPSVTLVTPSVTQPTDYHVKNELSIVCSIHGSHFITSFTID